MESPAIIRQIAQERLAEAKILANSKKFDGAFYLAGYSVELMLKAKICEYLDIPNLFDEEQSTKINDPGFGEIRRIFKTHNLLHLLWLSGLRRKFDHEKAENQKLFNLNSLLFENWDEQIRYKPCGYCKSIDVLTMLQILEDPEEGLFLWIQQN